MEGSGIGWRAPSIHRPYSGRQQATRLAISQDRPPVGWLGVVGRSAPLEYSSAGGTGPAKVIKMIKAITHGASASLDHVESLGRRETAAAAAPPAITPGTRLSYGSLLGGEPRSVERLRPEEANDGIVSEYARG